MKQTAVEWLFDNLNITGGSDDMKAFEQAKQMEKDQIIETWKHGNLPTFLGRQLTAEQYYNETYGKDSNADPNRMG